MSERDFEAKYGGFRDRLDKLLAEYRRANPGHFEMEVLTLLSSAIMGLQRMIEDPEAKATDWEHPDVILPWEVSVDEKLEPLYLHVTPDQLKNEKTMAKALLDQLLTQGAISTLRFLTKDLVIRKDGRRFKCCFPSTFDQRLKALSEYERNCARLSAVSGRVITLKFTGSVLDRDGIAREVRGLLAVRFSPLLIDIRSRRAFYPIRVSLECEGCQPTDWSDEARKKFWLMRLAEMEDLVPEEDTDCLAPLEALVALREVTITTLVKPEHAADFQGMIQSFATWQAEHLDKTGRFLPLVGPLKLSEVSPDLTERESRDYEKYKYCRHDRIDIPGTVPRMRSNLVVVNQRQIEVPDQAFQILLRLVVELKKRKGGWVYRSDFKKDGIVDDAGRHQPYSELRKALKPALGEKAEHRLIETGSAKRLRLSTHPNFITYNKKELRSHPDPVIARLAQALPRSRRPKK